MCAAKKKVVAGSAGRGDSLCKLGLYVTKCVGHSGTMPSGGAYLKKFFGMLHLEVEKGAKKKTRKCKEME